MATKHSHKIPLYIKNFSLYTNLVQWGSLEGCFSMHLELGRFSTRHIKAGFSHSGPRVQTAGFAYDEDGL